MPLYDSPYQIGSGFRTSRYIPRYAGAPIAEVEATATALQDRYYKNIADLDQLDILASNLTVAAGDTSGQQYKNRTVGNIRDSIQSIVDRGGDFENATLLTRRLARDFATDQGLRQIQENAQRIQEEQGLIQKLGASNIRMDSSYRDTFQSVNPDGTLNIYTPTAEQRLDYDKRMESFFDDIVADSGMLGLRDLTPQDARKLPGYIRSGNWQGISSNKIKRYLNSAFNRYMETPEYQQQRKFGDTDDEIRSRLLSAGLEKVFSRETSNLIKAAGGADAANRDKEEAFTRVFTNPLKGKELDLDDFDGGGIEGLNWKTSIASGIPILRTTPEKTIENYASSKEAVEKYGTSLSDVIGDFPRRQNESNEDYNARVKTRYDEKINRLSTVKGIFEPYQDVKTRRDQTELLLGVANEAGEIASPGRAYNNAFYILRDDGTVPTPLQIKDVADAFDMEIPELIRKSSANGEIRSDNPFSPTGTQFGVISEDGEEVYSFIVTDLNLREASRKTPSYILSQPQYNINTKESSTIETVVQGLPVRLKAVAVDTYTDANGNEVPANTPGSIYTGRRTKVVNVDDGKEYPLEVIMQLFR